MASCQVADGKAVGADIKKAVAAELKELTEKYPGFQPQLSIIQVTLQQAVFVPCVLHINLQAEDSRLEFLVYLSCVSISSANEGKDHIH